MTNGLLSVTSARTEVLQEIQGRTVYLEARTTNTASVGMANRDMPFSNMKHLAPGQWFSISAEFSERFFFKTDSGTLQDIEWWYED